MPRLNILRPSWQVAAYLREELMRGTWIGSMPGAPLLAVELGIDRKTAEAALAILEKERLLVGQGPGRRRRIELPECDAALRQLRVGILVAVPGDKRLNYMLELQHELAEAGNRVIFSERTMSALGMDVRRIARMVAATEADAWVVVAGSGEVLRWFAAWDKPAFALFGRRRGLPIAGAGPDKPPAFAAATRTLVELGHRRIVLLARRMRRLPKPGTAEQAFLDTMASYGLLSGPYNLPDWVESADGYHARLESLFRLSPPTALIVDEVSLFTAAQQFLAAKGLRVPADVSLVCTDYDDSFEWCRPRISHIRWNSGPVVKRIARWAENVNRGRKDLRQTMTAAEFVEGGTIGPAKG